MEIRQPLGFDKNLPGSGVLIMYADDSIPECRHGRGPVTLINADPSAPYLQGAAFDLGKKELFEDSENGVLIRLLEKKGRSYKLLVEHRNTPHKSKIKSLSGRGVLYAPDKLVPALRLHPLTVIG